MTVAFQVVLLVMTALAAAAALVLTSLAFVSEPTNVFVTPLVTLPGDFALLSALEQRYPGMRNARPVRASQTSLTPSSPFPTVSGAATAYTCPTTKRAYLEAFAYANPTPVPLSGIVLGVVDSASGVVLPVRALGTVSAGATGQSDGRCTVLMPGDLLVVWGDPGLHLSYDLVEYDDLDGSFTRVVREVSDVFTATYKVPAGQQFVRPDDVQNPALFAHTHTGPVELVVRYQNSAASLSSPAAPGVTDPTVTVCDPVPRILAAGSSLTFTADVPAAVAQHVVWFSGILVPA